MFLSAITLLQMSMREKNSYVHFLIAGVCLAIFVIIKISKSNNKSNAIKQSIDFKTQNNVADILRVSHSLNRSNPQNAIAGFKRVLELEPDNWEAAGAIGVLSFNSDNASSFYYLKQFNEKLKQAKVDITSPYFNGLALSFYILGYHYKIEGNMEEALKLKAIAMKSREFQSEYASFRLQFQY